MSGAVPDALLFVAGGCPHCPVVLQGLVELVKAGDIGALEVVNLDRHPERGTAQDVRAVPWLRLGALQLEGLQSPAELKHWAGRALTPEGVAEYAAAQLGSGRLQTVVEGVRREPLFMEALLHLLADGDTDIHVRLGIGAVFEGLQGDPRLQAAVPALAGLAGNADARVRCDVAHYLGLTESAGARPPLERLAQDTDAQVREIARESLEDLRETASP